MAESETKKVDLADVERLVSATGEVVREAIDVARKRTDGGKGIDDEQVHAERVAYAATEVAAARELLKHAKDSAAHRSTPPKRVRPRPAGKSSGFAARS